MIQDILKVKSSLGLGIGMSLGFDNWRNVVLIFFHVADHLDNFGGVLYFWLN